MVTFKIILFFSYLLISEEISFGDISFQVVQKGESNRHYIWLHGDEKTAKMALSSHMREKDGKAFFINYLKNKDIDFFQSHGNFIHVNFGLLKKKNN